MGADPSAPVWNHTPESAMARPTWQGCYGCLVEEPQWAGWVAQRELGAAPAGKDGAPVTGQIKGYKGVSEMFDEEGKGQVKTDELEQLMSFLGISSTKSELASTAKDVDRVKKGFFNCSNFLALMGGVLGEGPEPRVS
uniref:Uncharacterized protein n=1 Tax=Rangifer tarandus platyrhynchus TaxID=3082113 RepID=A0ACB0FLQ5_RANTA|nr:unnamed protein product [Rangifer tarandus platyrhynchus]